MSPEAMPAHRRSREVWVGVFVIAGGLAALLLLFTITNPAMLRGRYFAYAVVESASGLRRGDPVRLRGVNIGRVRDFAIVPEGVAVRLELDRNVPVPADSTVVVRGTSLMAEMEIEIQPGQSTQRLKSNGTLRGAVASGVLSRVGDIAAQAQSALAQVQRLLSPENVANVERSTTELADLLKSLAKSARDLGTIAESVNRSAEGVERAAAGPELAEITSQLSRASASLAQSASSAEVVLGRMQRGEGSLGRLSRDDALYVNANHALQSLDAAAQSLNRLVEDVRKNPERYVKISIF